MEITDFLIQDHNHFFMLLPNTVTAKIHVLEHLKQAAPFGEGYAIEWRQWKEVQQHLVNQGFTLEEV